jgi:uncharacterized membrane protein YbjE (DUF340 family)
VAFQEKIEWLTLLAMAVVYAVYFSMVAAYPDEPTLIQTLWLFAKVLVVHVVIVTVGAIALAVLNRRDASARSDERDRAISRRGASIAYYVLLIGAIIVCMVLPFEQPPTAKSINAGLLAIVISPSSLQKWCAI